MWHERTNRVQEEQRRGRCGQSTVEYAVLIAVVIGALVAMQIFMKRGTMGKLRESTDQIGEQFSAHHTRYSGTIHSGSTRHEETKPTGFSKSSLTADEVQSRTNADEHIDTALTGAAGEKLFE
jgi:hypothetical protein